MTTVILARDWFDPDGRLWLVRDNPHQMEWSEKDLPKSAEVKQADKPVEEKSAKKL